MKLSDLGLNAKDLIDYAGGELPKGKKKKVLDAIYKNVAKEVLPDEKTPAHLDWLDEEFMMKIRESEPERVYSPRTLNEVLESINSGHFVIDDSIEVRVKDSWHRFPSGNLPCQKVTISFDFCRLYSDKGEKPFDRELQNAGYLPNN